MYDFYQKNRNYIIIGGIVIIIAFLLWFIFSVRSDNQRGTVSAVNDDITETRRDLERAGKLTGELADGLSNSQSQVSGIGEEVSRVRDELKSSEDTVSNVITSNARSQELIAEGRRTTSEIRARLQNLPETNGEKSKNSNQAA